VKVWWKCDGGGTSVATVLAHVLTGTRANRQTSIDKTDTSNSTRNDSTTMTPIKEAIAAIELRALGDDLVYQEYADWFGVD
jgi:hypothetical protein